MEGGPMLPLRLFRMRGERFLSDRTVARLPDDLAVLQEGNRLAPNLPLQVVDDLGRILGQKGTQHFVVEIRSAAMEDVTGEDGDAAGRNDDRKAGVLAKIANEIVRF